VADVASDWEAPDEDCGGLPLSGSIAGSADAAVSVLVAVGIDERERERGNHMSSVSRCHVDRK
jgi:hypothetical protein